MIELKPCPFCGGKAKVFDNHKDFDTERVKYGVKCTKCKMYMTFEDKLYSKSLVVRGWNRRTDENV